MSGKRALVCALMPEDDRDSGSRRVLHLVEALMDAGWAVTFVSHHANPTIRYVKALQQRGIDVYAGAAKWMDQLIATKSYGLVALGLWDIAEPYIVRIRTASPDTRILVDSIDLHFLRQARRIFQESSEAGTCGALDGGYASDMIRELNTYAAADVVLAVSSKEAHLINDLTGDSSLAFAVPDGEDLPPSPVPLLERRGMVFVGCYRFSPNVKAVEYLCRDILPRVSPALLAQHPAYIVGDGLNDTVRAFASHLPDSYTRMVGWVPSVEPYIQRARISVVPLLYGAGTKRKVLQALMYGTPTVSTSIGVEGLNLEHGRHVLVADDPAAFAKATEQLLTDDRMWERLRVEGLAHINANHGRRGAREQMIRAVEAALAKPPKKAAAILAANAQTVFTPDEYQKVVDRIRRLVDRTVPSSAGVIVFSKGDDALLKLGPRAAHHYPQSEDGRYAGHYPKDSSQAISSLQRIHASGAEYVLLPATASWWLDHYTELNEHLAREYEVVADERDTGILYRLHASPVSHVEVSDVVNDRDTAPVHGDERVNVRAIAFLLPQFHPIPENDVWWGKGFTEWTNVTKARPLFDGHYQPRLPADLGFYDLRLPEVRAAQASMAAAYGIHGFSYYHYWFEGKLLLERPFNDVLRSGEPDFPFCLCWANEPWSRRWDGRPKDVLQDQAYSAADDLAHIRWLMPALADPRAITIDGKPVFLVYQSKDLPDPRRTTDTWREEVNKAGLPGIFLITCETGWDAGWDASPVGFDAKVLFQPQFALLFGSGTQISTGSSEKLRVFDYQRAWRVLSNPQPVSYERFNTVCPSWDNTARAGEKGVVLHNSTPKAYEEWLEHAVREAATRPVDHRIVFLNAWNEWAEGCQLEPDKRHGRAYLEATRRALGSAGRKSAGGASRRNIGVAVGADV